MTILFTSRLFGSKKQPRRRELHQGQHKNVLEGTCPDTVVLFFKDTLAHHGEIMEISGIGAINQRITELLFAQLTHVGINNHFIKSLNMREQLVQATEVLPLRVRVYTSVTEDLALRYNVEAGTPLERPLVEFYTTSKRKEILSKDHILAFDLADEEEIFEIEELARRACDVLFGFTSAKGLHLQAMDLQFGRVYGADPFEDAEIMIINELSPRTLHMIDMVEGQGLSLETSPLKEQDISMLYQTVLDRFGLIQAPEILETKE